MTEGMNRMGKLAASVAAVVLAVMFLAPMIPAKIISGQAASLTSLHVPPQGADRSGWGELTDPSGSYWIYALNDTTCGATQCYATSAMNLTSFERLQNDPYSGGVWNNPNCMSAIQGSVILLSCPSPRCSRNHFNGAKGCSPVTQKDPSIVSGFDSVAYWLLRHGALYAGGKLLWV